MTRLAIVCDLDRLKQLALEFIAERGEFCDDSDTLRRQLTLSDFLLWLRKRMETTDEKSNNATD